jgi:hypothetical protein
MRSPLVLASAVLLLAVILHGFMTRYESGPAVAATVVDRWTGEICAGDRCWKRGRQTAPEQGTAGGDPLDEELKRIRGARP